MQMQYYTIYNSTVGSLESDFNVITGMRRNAAFDLQHQLESMDLTCSQTAPGQVQVAKRIPSMLRESQRIIQSTAQVDCDSLGYTRSKQDWGGTDRAAVSQTCC